MPCDTISTNEVDLKSIGRIDAKLMHLALQALRLSPIQQGSVIRFGRGEYIDVATGKSELASNRDANQIKRSYAAEVVKSQAKKNGWTLKETAPFQYEVSKRF